MRSLVSNKITIEDIEDFTRFNSDLSMIEDSYDKDCTILVDICSSGGDAYIGYAMAGRLEVSINPIHTRIFGACASASVLVAIVGDHRSMSKFAHIMLHESSISSEGKVRTSEAKSLIDHLTRDEERYYLWLSKYSNRSVDYWRDRIGSRDVYLTAEEALELGLVDEIF